MKTIKFLTAILIISFFVLFGCSRGTDENQDLSTFNSSNIKANELKSASNFSDFTIYYLEDPTQAEVEITEEEFKNFTRNYNDLPPHANIENVSVSVGEADHDAISANEQDGLFFAAFIEPHPTEINAYIIGPKTCTCKGNNSNEYQLTIKGNSCGCYSLHSDEEKIIKTEKATLGGLYSAALFK